MSFETYARWLSLLEGVDLISKKMNQYGHRLKNQDIDWIKPLAFQKYITERQESMKFELEEHDKINDLQQDLNKQEICTTSLEPVLK